MFWLSLQVPAILFVIWLASAVLLRAAVALTNRFSQADEETKRIQMPGLAWAFIVMTIAVVPASFWVAAMMPATSKSHWTNSIVPFLVCFPLSILFTGGIFSLLLSTTWGRGMCVVLWLDAILVVAFAVAGIAALGLAN